MSTGWYLMPQVTFSQSSKNRDLLDIVQRTLIGEYGIRCSIKPSKSDGGDKLVISPMTNVRKVLEIFTSVPLYGLKRWDSFLMKTLFDEIISKKLQNTPDGIAATIDLKYALHNPTQQELLDTAAARLPREQWEQRFGLAKGASRGGRRVNTAKD